MKKIYFFIIYISLILIVISSDQLYAKTNKWNIDGKKLSVTFEKSIQKEEYRTLNIFVSDIQEPVILIVTFYPVDEEIFMGAKPNSLKDKYDIKGVLLTRKISTTGNQQLNFSPEAFTAKRFYGNGEPRFKEWSFDIILASDIFLHRLPEAGVRNLGSPLIINAQDLGNKFVMLTSFPDSPWTEHISPIEPFLINDADGGFFQAVPNSSIIENLKLLVPR